MFSKRTKMVSVFVGGVVLAVAVFGAYKFYFGANAFDTGTPLLASAAVDGQINLVDEGFDIDNLPQGWVHRTFFNITPTDYKLAEIDGKTALQCSTNNSGSILGRDVSVKLSEFPLLKWQWKIDKPLQSDLDEETEAGDDHPARFFVMFNNEDGSRSAAEIIWSNKRFVKGDYKIIGSFYHLVANGLDENVGIWHDEVVDLQALYSKVSGVSADPSLSLLGFFCDSDNTGGSTNAYFADVRLEAKTD